MANVKVKNADASNVYLKASGAGSDVDPNIPEHLETNSAAIKTAVETLAGAVDTEVQVDVVSLPDTRESWRMSNVAEETANDSDKTLTVPADTEYQVLGIRVELTTTATAGDRQIVVQWRDAADDVIGEVRAGAVQAASLTRIYMFAPGLADLTSFRDTDYLTGSLPTIFLAAGFDVRVFDNNVVDAAADDMDVQMQVASRSVA